LEATIAVMLVSGVLLVVYSKQNNNRNIGPGEYVYNMQKQILMDISSNTSNRDLRNEVLSGNDSMKLNLYVRRQIPNVFSYSLKVCNLTDPPTTCKLSPEKVIATRNADRDIYADGTIISADFASGYHPMKVNLFVWKKIINNSCGPQCSPGVSSNLCSDSTTVKNITCGEFNGNSCLENQTTYQTCKPNEICKNGTCESTPVKCGPSCSPSKTCSSDSKEVLTKTCKIDDAGCLVYNGTTSVPCEPTKICNNGKCVNAFAKLSATISVTAKWVNGSRHYQGYNLVIKETNGVKVNITSGRQCLLKTGCDSWVLFSPPRRVPANGQYTRNLSWWTSFSSDEYWLVYEGKDDNNHSIEIKTNKLFYP